MDFVIKRLDHLGIVAGTIKHLGLIGLIDERLKKDGQGKVTQGEGVAAMILNGLGFTSEPLSLTPQFFETKPLDILIGPGIEPEDLNRHKLGRILDAIADYGCEQLYNEIALLICMQEKISLRKCHNDTTSFSVSGEYKNQEEDAEVFFAKGYPKNKRYDLKQIVLELCVSCDGGVPFIMKPWSGNASDNKIFNERIKALKEGIARSDTGIVQIADSKLYTKENIAELGSRHFITRVPSSIKEVEKRVVKSIEQNLWTKLDDENKVCVFKISHYGVDQRWVVVYSDQANKRTKKTMSKKLGKQEEQLKKDLFHLQAQRFACEIDAQMALAKIVKQHKYFSIKDVKVTQFESYGKRGRPAANSTKTISKYKIEASYCCNQQLFDRDVEKRSCYVLATNVPEEMLSTRDVVANYKGQDCVERGFAFLKSPSFFASAFYLKSPKRIQAMLVIMTLSLLIYTIAQRILRKNLKNQKKTIPNQINQPTQRPTLRWVFKCMQGINYVIVKVNNTLSIVINGITDLMRTILSCFGEEVQRVYQT